MGLYTRLQLLEKVGLDPGSNSDRGKVSMALKRGNLILNGDGFIDDTEPKNSIWISNYMLRVATKQPVLVDDAESLEETPSARTSTRKPRNQNPLPKSSGDLYKLEQELKQQELEKKTVETRLLELKEQKMRGELIPTDLVKIIFAQHSKSMVTEFKNDIEGMLTIFSKKTGMNSNQVAEMRGQILEAINNAVAKSVDHSKKNLDAIVNEFVEVKGVGEHG
jgi:hypothetical protein